ncbi:UNVERIFIED_CONTAM: Pentatricopeptide repeat-containing protein, chloroplastic [Sesamum calycinum]|uniref:Pentatricopeptide repeat-containing protein, chloroplastic n=1 Tax=Sesamum calycinum TaxID=2727403 RepID=A0AAW2MNI8_9LAMI
MLGKCKQPEKAHTLFQAMIDDGCVVDREAYTALMSAYSRSGLFDKAFYILEKMKTISDCQPDVYTYSILIKSCLQVNDFGKVQSLLSDMEIQRIKPNTITYNTLLDAYGKAKRFIEMESLLVQMLRQRECQPDEWTMNSSLRAFGGSGQIEMMEKCYEKFLRAGIEPNIKTFNILLDSYGKTGNYEKMSSSERIKPNCVTLCSLIRAYGNDGKAEKIAAVIRFIDNSDVMLDTVFFNCLVDSYGMMGCFAEMKGVIEMMKRSGCEPDKITYRTMIKAYTISGMTSQAKELQNELASLRGFS